jgi:flagellar hook-associated protein 3 FlgL
MRITNAGQTARILSQLAQAQQRMADAQNTMTSGQRITQPSDDPFGTSQVLQMRQQLDNSTQYQRSISLASDDLNATESALTNLDTVLQRANELAVQAGNASLDSSARDQIAYEVDRLIDEAVTISNTKQGGRYIFGGFQTTAAPFTPNAAPPTAIPYAGDSGQINREIGPNDRLSVNVPGDQVFSGVFTALMQFRDNLRTNNVAGLQTDPSAFTAQLENSLRYRSDVGAKSQRLDMATNRLQETDLSLKSSIAKLQDADMVDAVTQLQTRSTAYQAAMAAAGKVMSFSLLDFLR